MDSNTADVLKTLIAALFAVIGWGMFMWGITRDTDLPSTSYTKPEQYTWEYKTSITDDDDDDEIQDYRDRLAAALWENRRLSREKAGVRDA